GVGRVIARPFIGKEGSFTRTDGRRDFSLRPPEDNLLTSLMSCGLDVISVGKIKDIFAGVGITEAIPTHSNSEGITAFLELLRRDFNGLCFINLVDFDMKYGHRQDAVGYALALNEFDACLSKALPVLREDDVLIITADHGCDPSDDSTDHTREHTPLIIYGKSILPADLGTGESFANIGKTVCSLLGVKPGFTLGEDLTSKILK
ncbi:MAG: phosphopentomutase, partial [Clostridia bacterium]|nr:phosphopentomutase [Clostridia bacterium]